MNWDAISFNWNQVRAFLVTAEAGSLSAGARALGLTQPTLGRQVAGLEEALGVTLFDRVGKALVLTPTGRDLLGHVRDMGDAASRISLTASGHAQTLEGDVTVTVSDVTAIYHLPEVLASLRAKAPGIRLTVIAANDLRDLRRREADIALRHVRPTHPDLIARRLPDMTGGFYATPGYLARHGTPATAAEIGDAVFVGYAPADRMIAALNEMGVPVTHRNLMVLSDNGAAMWEMVRQGLGIGVMTREVGDATPGVVRILPDVATMPIEVWLTTHRELQTSRIIRVVFDHLAEAFGAARQPSPVGQLSDINL